MNRYLIHFCLRLMYLYHCTHDIVLSIDEKKIVVTDISSKYNRGILKCMQEVLNDIFWKCVVNVISNVYEILKKKQTPTTYK